MTTRLDYSLTPDVPTEDGACATCKVVLTYHAPALRHDEKLLCPPCAKATGATPPKGAEYLRLSAHPVERLAALHSERFERRFGVKPAPAVVEAWKEDMLKWPPGPKLIDVPVEVDGPWAANGRNGWTYLADAMTWFKVNHPVSWGRKSILLGDQARAFAKMGSDALQALMAKDQARADQEHRASKEL